MDVQATSRYLPISPTKIRLVCDQVRGLSPLRAVEILRFMPQKGAPLVRKVIQSAIANAENNFELDPAEMVIAHIYANEGPRRQWRRFGARGRFKPWVRRTSHLTVVLSENEMDEAAVTAEAPALSEAADEEN
jgi:large subunit ribosomal protein L22